MSFLKHMIRTKHHDYHHYDNHHLDRGVSYHQGHIGSAILTRLTEGIIRNKALLVPILIAIVVAGVILAMLCVFAVIKLVPWALSMVGYDEQIGLNGIVDVALRMIRSIWEGGGKG